MDLHADRGAALERLEVIEEKIAAAKEAAAAYEAKLQISSLEHEKAAELLKIQAWIDDRSIEYSPVANWEDTLAAAEEEAASNPDYVSPRVPAALKSTTRELELLIKQQEDKYFAVVDETEAKLCAIKGHEEAPQVEIDAKVAALTDKLNLLRDDADSFSKILKARLEMLKGHLDNIRTFNAGAAELTISIDELSEGLRAPLQVDSVLAAEKMVETFKADTMPMAESIKLKFAELEPAGVDLLAISEVEEEIRSAFTLYNLEDLREAANAIATSTTDREQDLVGEPDGLLIKEKAKEKLRIEFAMAATGTLVVKIMISFESLKTMSKNLVTQRGRPSHRQANGPQPTYSPPLTPSLPHPTPHSPLPTPHSPLPTPHSPPTPQRSRSSPLRRRTP